MEKELLVPGTEDSVYGARYYKDQWEKIQDNHYPECPVSIAAGKKLISTCCMCPQIEAAQKEADECLRCHQFPEFCKCGVKAQF